MFKRGCICNIDFWVKVKRQPDTRVQSKQTVPTVSLHKKENKQFFIQRWWEEGEALRVVGAEAEHCPYPPPHPHVSVHRQTSHVTRSATLHSVSSYEVSSWIYGGSLVRKEEAFSLWLKLEFITCYSSFVCSSLL